MKNQTKLEKLITELSKRFDIQQLVMDINNSETQGNILLQWAVVSLLCADVIIL